MTPFDRSDVLSDELGADVWVKDETGNVGGSHKGRHLAGALLHLRAARGARAGRSVPPAARHRVVRQRGDRRGDTRPARRVAAEVFVPDWADENVIGLLASLGAYGHALLAARPRPAG